MLRGTSLFLSAGMIVVCGLAQAEVCLAPGQVFACVGNECPVEAGVESGQQHDVVLATRRVRVRAVDSNLSTESSYAEIFGAVVEPNAPMFLRAHLDVSYSGFLTGFGGGVVNFGSVEIRAIVRDLEANEIVASAVITGETNQGSPGMGGPSAFDNLFGPPAVRDVPHTGDDTGVRLEAGRQYGVGFGVRARARGGAINVAESDFFTGGHGVFLNSLHVVTWTDPDVAGFEDDDGDGLPNVWETEGITDCQGTVLLDLPNMGADPDRKDLFVEIDWLAGQEPDGIMVDVLKESFVAAPGNAGGVDTPEGITLWLDTGGLTDSGGALVGDNLGGGNEIPVSDIPDPGGEFIPPLWEVGGAFGFDYDSDIDDNGRTDFYEVKRQNFDLIRTRVFRYSVFANPRNEDDNKYPGGQAEVGGDDSVIFDRTPGLVMHELGHNLGLDHGGHEMVNCKPNYVSVMNYALTYGIPRRSLDMQAQDTDADGNVDARVLDYSPPRFPGGRGQAPIFSSDEGLVESALSERVRLDPTDAANSTRYFNPDGDGRDLDMDEEPDWNDDGVNNTPTDIVSVDINGSDQFPGCDLAPELGLTELVGHDDWSTLQLPIMLDGIIEEVVENDGGQTPVPEVPDPDADTMEEIEALFNTIDLSVMKSGVPELVMAGQELTYEITVANAGPNTALEVIVEDGLPELVTLLDLPDTCTLSEDDILTCQMSPIAAGTSATLTLLVQVSPRLPCGRADTITLTNTVSVSNGDWPDVNPANNEATFESEALCLRYEYAAKFVCGSRADDGSLLAAPGRYGTIVNVHNFQSRTIPFFKKLALAFPPEEQRAGPVHPIGIDELAYDQTLKADCDDIARRLFDNELPSGFIDGYLVVQSPRRLDVDVFYSAAAGQGAGAGAPANARSIDVEHVTERDLRADLTMEKSSQIFPIPLQGPDFLAQFRFFAVLYTIRIHNDGSVHAENIEIADTVSLNIAGPTAAAIMVPDDPFEIPDDAERSAIIHEAGPPMTARFTVTLPELPPGDGAEIRFWTLALIYLSDPQNPANRADLIDRAETSGQGPEVTLVNNKSETLDTLVE